jgi:MFS superfamily sulfate permease-like transporter
MNHHTAFNIVRHGQHFLVRFAKDATFPQKIALKRTLAQIPNNSQVSIDGGGAMFIDHDILELIQEFRDSSENRKINVEIRNFPSSKFNLVSAIRNRSV